MVATGRIAWGGRVRTWRGARVAESGGLENRCPGNWTVGSNPTLSPIVNRHAWKQQGHRRVVVPESERWDANGDSERYMPHHHHHAQLTEPYRSLKYVTR